MMTADDIRTLKPGDLVRALTPVSGETGFETSDEMLEFEMPAGHVAVVSFLDTYPAPQGQAVVVDFDSGIYNTFDEGDDEGRFNLERIEDTPQTRRERVAFLMAHAPADYPESELAHHVARIMAGPPAPEQEPEPEPEPAGAFHLQPIVKHWAVTIDPEDYDDADDHGFGWSGPARDAQHAVEQACRACEHTNDWDEGHINAATVSFFDSGPDLAHHARQCWKAVASYDDAMGDQEQDGGAQAPTGDDYNELYSLVKAWIGDAA